MISSLPRLASKLGRGSVDVSWDCGEPAGITTLTPATQQQSPVNNMGVLAHGDAIPPSTRPTERETRECAATRARAGRSVVCGAYTQVGARGSHSVRRRAPSRAKFVHAGLQYGTLV